MSVHKIPIGSAELIELCIIPTGKERGAVGYIAAAVWACSSCTVELRLQFNPHTLSRTHTHTLMSTTGISINYSRTNRSSPHMLPHILNSSYSLCLSLFPTPCLTPYPTPWATALPTPCSISLPSLAFNGQLRWSCVKSQVQS